MPRCAAAAPRASVRKIISRTRETTSAFSARLRRAKRFGHLEQIGSYDAIATRAQEIDLFAPHRAIEWIAVQQNDGEAIAFVIVGSVRMRHEASNPSIG